MELTLGLSEADLAQGDDASFAQLGGDSLAAIQFARSIDDLCGVPLPVSFVLDHSNSLAGITAKACTRRANRRTAAPGQRHRPLRAAAVLDRLIIWACTPDLTRMWSMRATPCARGSLGRIDTHLPAISVRAMP